MPIGLRPDGRYVCGECGFIAGYYGDCPMCKQNKIAQEAANIAREQADQLRADAKKAEANLRWAEWRAERAAEEKFLDDQAMSGLADLIERVWYSSKDTQEAATIKHFEDIGLRASFATWTSAIEFGRRWNRVFANFRIANPHRATVVDIVWKAYERLLGSIVVKRNDEDREELSKYEYVTEGELNCSKCDYTGRMGMISDRLRLDGTFMGYGLLSLAISYLCWKAFVWLPIIAGGALLGLMFLGFLVGGLALIIRFGFAWVRSRWCPSCKSVVLVHEESPVIKNLSEQTSNTTSQTAPAGSAKGSLVSLVISVVVLLAGAGYWGWTKQLGTGPIVAEKTRENPQRKDAEETKKRDEEQQQRIKEAAAKEKVESEAKAMKDSQQKQETAERGGLQQCAGSYSAAWNDCVGESLLWNGTKYVGTFKGGKPNGQGTETRPDGSSFVGEWRDGRPNGQGVMTFKDGAKYVGELREGKRHGQGTYTYPNGATYIGEWLDNQKSGKGSYARPDGSKYVGEFRADNINGFGISYAPDGRAVYAGQWIDNKRADQQAQQESISPAAAPTQATAPVEASRSPQEMCADRPNFISRGICERKECENNPAHKGNAYCETLKQSQNQFPGSN